MGLFKNKIFLKQFTSFLIIFFITFSSLSIVVLLVTEKSIEKQQLSIVKNYRIETSQRMYEWLNGRVYDIKSLAVILEKLDEDFITSEKLTEIINGQLDWNNNYYNLLVIDENGDVINSLDGRMPDINLSDRQYVINGLKGKSTITGFFTDRKDGYPIMGIAEPIHIDGKHKYVFAGFIELERFKTIVDNMDFGEFGHAYLVDSNGALITDTEYISNFIKNGGMINKDEFKIDSVAVDNVIKEKSGTGTYVDFMEEKVFGSYQWIQPLKVGLIVEFKESIAMSPIYELYKVILLLVLVTFIMVFIASFILSKRIVDPIHMLIKAVEDVTVKNYQKTINIRTNSELDILINGFNHMKNAVKEREKLLEEKNIELKIQKEKAIEANKLKSQFLANMSHELRTPLNSIIGFTNRLLKKTKDVLSPIQYENLVIVREEAQNLLVLINSLLDYSKIEYGKMELQLEQFDLITVVKEIRPIVNNLIVGKPIEYREVFYNTESIPIYSDPIKVRQIFINLLSNAAKYSEKGTITFSIIRQEDKYCITVEDEGVGIAAEHINKIFNEFWQVDGSYTRKVGGTGLGLSITKRFVEMLGGSINVMSTIGKGSCFTVYLPICIDPQHNIEELIK